MEKTCVGVKIDVGDFDGGRRVWYSVSRRLGAAEAADRATTTQSVFGMRALLVRIAELFEDIVFVPVIGR
jgi:hypothetical protein